MPTEREIKMARLMLEDSSPERQYRMLSILAVHDPFLFADLWGMASEDIFVMSGTLVNNNAMDSERKESSGSRKDSEKRSRAGMFLFIPCIILGIADAIHRCSRG
jgi:hypothetical protein